MVNAPVPVTLPEGHYQVKRGDTLYSIALENGADYREVAAWNRLDDPTKIRVGQVLRVKPDESRAVTVKPATVAAPIEARPLDAPSAPAGTRSWCISRTTTTASPASRPGSRSRCASRPRLRHR